MRVWRICKSKYSAAAFAGEGARLYGGRWNPVGTSMVYTSPSLALASVETFVHVDPSLAPSDLVYVVATIPDTIHVSRIDVEALPADWRSIKHPELQKIGDDWVTSGSSLVLEVPSVAVEDEWNILLNPNHPDFSQITIEAPVKWKFDERMFRRS